MKEKKKGGNENNRETKQNNNSKKKKKKKPRSQEVQGYHLLNDQLTEVVFLLQNKYCFFFFCLFSLTKAEYLC